MQFTTARGAAQRVFEMLDALPDVDLNAGVRLNRAELRGTIDLDRVTFAYQMRPKEKVINDVSLTIDGGSTVAFVGKFGGGKQVEVYAEYGENTNVVRSKGPKGPKTSMV